MPIPAEPDRDPDWLDRVRRALVDWYERGHRDLPWRRERDPYRILVSETMLVQTTVAAVVPFYERFLARFPTALALAEADEADVLKSWEGLGYYRRARQLQEAARAIVRDHDGTIPADLEAIRALPGVGRYIAGAVLSFAFDRPAPIVEANTRRVLARWLAWDSELDASASQARFWEAAARLVPSESAGTFNQAFMELGAVVCTPKAPMCLICPVSRDCRARELGRQDSLPIKAPRLPPLAVAEAAALVARGDRVLIVRRGPGRLWAGFWEFPTIHLDGADPAGRSFGEPVDLAEGVRRLAGVRAAIGPVVRTIRFGVTKHRVELTAHAGIALDSDPGADPIPGPGLDRAAWERPETLAEHPFSSAGRRLAAWVADRGAIGLRTLTAPGTAPIRTGPG